MWWKITDHHKETTNKEMIFEVIPNTLSCFQYVLFFHFKFHNNTRWDGSFILNFHQTSASLRQKTYRFVDIWWCASAMLMGNRIGRRTMQTKQRALLDSGLTHSRNGVTDQISRLLTKDPDCLVALSGQCVELASSHRSNGISTWWNFNHVFCSDDFYRKLNFVDRKTFGCS